MANNLQIFLECSDTGGHRDAVVEQVKALGRWAKVSPGLWYVKSTYSASDARNHIIEKTSTGDTVFVVDASSGHAAWHGVSSEVATFIKERWVEA